MIRIKTGRSNRRLSHAQKTGLKGFIPVIGAHTRTASQINRHFIVNPARYRLNIRYDPTHRRTQNRCKPHSPARRESVLSNPPLKRTHTP